jgi:PilZ domain
MEKEYDAGVAYLKALKQPVAGATATGTLTEAHPGSVVTPGNRFRGPEKRRSLRYQCEGSIEMCEDGSDAHTWARFTDISLHGCYVEAQEVYPKGTVLHLKLEANGVRVESKGNVRVTYPQLGMGIAFVETSQETSARLREMLMRVSPQSSLMGPGIASTLLSGAPLVAVPLIANPASAMLALIEFFENRQMLMREDFLRIVRMSQGLGTKK